MTRRKRKQRLRWISILSLLFVVGVTGCFLYMLHTGEAQKLMNLIRHLGSSGVLIGIAVQTFLNLLPLPGEFTALILMEIYGPFWGGVYVWISGMLGAIGGLSLARWIARSTLGGVVHASLGKVEDWAKKRGDFGLLLIRFVPLVPYHLVNYAAGLLRVRFWGFVWTTALGLAPYSIALSGIYAGLKEGSILWGAIGCSIFLVLAAVGLILKKRKQEAMLSCDSGTEPVAGK